MRTLTTEDMDDIARIVVNQNVAILQARINAIEELLETGPNLRDDLSDELRIAAGHLKHYRALRYAQVEERDKARGGAA